MTMIELEIDGKTLIAESGETIIQVADKAGIYIPRFCYHKKLSVAASCRMCLVEVEKAPKTLPACATPIMPGMKISTRSEKALHSQKAVMEFLLINHPLDCPICDQGGECELQDLSLGYGKGISRFTEGKRAIHDENLGPLISTEMTRCIQCSRCVRFGDEIAGVRELGLMGRGEELEIATYIDATVQSELSGNMIDVCPVGALTSKPYRFTARAWELKQHASIAPHDCLGSNIYIHTRGEIQTPARQVMRVVPRENESINETWISNRDRFSYEAIDSEERVLKPRVKYRGEWQEVSWGVALAEAVHRLDTIIKQSTAAQIGALISPSSTTEECYLLQKIMRQIGSHHIDHRLRHADFPDQAYQDCPTLGFPIADLETLTGLLLVGANVRLEQPIASQRIRKAVKKGAKVMCINPIDYEFNFEVDQKSILGAAEFVGELSAILKILLIQLPKENISNELAQWIAPFELSPTATKIANQLLHAEKSAIILGAYAIGHPDAAMIRLLAEKIAALTKSHIGLLSHGANSAGAWLAGAIPHRTPKTAVDNPGLNAHEMLVKPLRAYLLFGVEPERDSAYPSLALNALKQAECVIALSTFSNDMIADYADIILPMATFAENSGTYVNAEGAWQTMAAATLPYGESQTGVAILCELAKTLHLPGFEYTQTSDILDELKTQLANKTATTNTLNRTNVYPQKTKSALLYRAGDWPIYHVDSLVRRAKALQASVLENVSTIRINAALAKKLHLQADSLVEATQADCKITLPLMIDERVGHNQVWIPSGLEITAGFGEAYGEIELIAGAC